MNNFEKGPEQFPSLEEIKSVLEGILKGREYKELKNQSDDKGVSCYEIEVVLENGEKAEYNFQRANYDYTRPDLNAEARFSASIHVVFYDADGLPVGGECVANYLDGNWQVL